MNRIRIYSDANYMATNAPHAEILLPFWGTYKEDKLWGFDRRFERYMTYGNQYFELVDTPDEADYAVLPSDWIFYLRHGEEERAISFTRKMAQFGRRVIVFLRDDLDDQVPLDNAFVFRTSLYRSYRRPWEYAMTSWVGDIIKNYLGNQVNIREYHSKPVVGFCGYAYGGEKKILRRRLKKALLQLGDSVGLTKRPDDHHMVLRSRSLRNLQKSSSITTNFIIRDGYFGGSRRQLGEKENAIWEVRRQYVENLISSDYCLAVRGKGNYSFRFYEILASGRIPIFIDTDCVLPYDFIVDWKQYCIWVDASELPHIGEKIMDFHSKLSRKQYQELQHECRQVWLDWVSPDGFFSRFHLHFQNTLG